MFFTKLLILNSMIIQILKMSIYPIFSCFLLKKNYVWDVVLLTDCPPTGHFLPVSSILCNCMWPLATEQEVDISHKRQSGAAQVAPFSWKVIKGLDSDALSETVSPK